MRIGLLLVGVAILLGGLLGTLVGRDPGYVMLAYGGTAIETSLWFAVLLLLVAVSWRRRRLWRHQARAQLRRIDDAAAPVEQWPQLLELVRQTARLSRARPPEPLQEVLQLAHVPTAHALRGGDVDDRRRDHAAGVLEGAGQPLGVPDGLALVAVLGGRLRRGQQARGETDEKDGSGGGVFLHNG